MISKSVIIEHLICQLDDNSFANNQHRGHILSIGFNNKVQFRCSVISISQLDDDSFASNQHRGPILSVGFNNKVQFRCSVML